MGKYSGSLDEDVTQEDLSVTDPMERERRYGQQDHVRSYGKDFMQRLEAAGFLVTVLSKEMLVDGEMLQRISVECEDQVWISTKGRLSELDEGRMQDAC